MTTLGERGEAEDGEVQPRLQPWAIFDSRIASPLCRGYLAAKVAGCKLVTHRVNTGGSSPPLGTNLYIGQYGCKRLHRRLPAW